MIYTLTEAGAFQSCLVLISKEVGLWLDPTQIEALVETDFGTTVCLKSGQEIKAHGLTAQAITDAIEDAFQRAFET